MKARFFVFILCIFPLFLAADFVRNYPMERTQPDGKKITLYATGDEFYGSLCDEKGFTVVQDSISGYDVYAVRDGSGLKPSQYRVGTADPVSLGITPKMAEDGNVIREKIRQLKANRPDTNDRNNTTGTINNLVIFVGFQDSPGFSYTPMHFSSFFDSSTGTSVKNYFWEDSNHQFNLNSTFYPQWDNQVHYIYGNNSRSYFSPHGAFNPDGYTNAQLAYGAFISYLREIVDYVGTQNMVPTSLNIDSNNDGKIDNITFVIIGTPGYPGDVLWPRTSTLSTGSFINSKEAETFNMVFEENHLGTYCHELSHTIGFPNLYREWWQYNSWTQSYDYYNVTSSGAWDPMGERTEVPAYHLVYMKHRYGNWCTLPTTINAEGYYSLSPVSSSPFQAYKIDSTWPNQYYLVEYRKQDGYFDSELPGSGLIVYRINTDLDGHGSVDGPPDEVYVYAPYGDIDTEGMYNTAFFSYESGRTAFHMYTNPTPFLSNGDDGGLVLTEIGPAGTTIRFRLRDMVPKVWLGAVSTNWTNTANWYNGVPNQFYDAEIPAALTTQFFNPVISSTTDVKSLHIASGANITVEGTLIVHEDIVSNGAIIVNGVNSVNTYGDIVWNYGATVTMASNNCSFETRGNMTFNPGSDINMTAGRFLFSDPGNSIITMGADADINVLESYKTSPNYLSIAGTASRILRINGGVGVYSGKALRVDLEGTLVIKGNLVVNGGLFNCYAGTTNFYLSGALGITASSTNGCDFNAVNVYAQTYTLSLNTPIKVKGALKIYTGILNPNNNAIEVQGNWDNDVGEDGFVEGTGQVIFSGSGNQYCYGEHFNTLVLNKSGGALIFPASSFTRCVSYDWTAGSISCNGGFFTADDLADAGIYGSLTLNSGQIELFQDAGSTIDLNGFITVHAGNFLVYGGSAASRWGNLVNSGITMDGGLLYFIDNGILDRVTAYTCALNITGGIIRTNRNFTVSRSNTAFNGGTIEMYGPSDGTISTGAGTNITFHNLSINELGRGADPYLRAAGKNQFAALPATGSWRTNIVTAGSSLTLTGALDIVSGTFVTSARTINVQRSITVSGTLQMLTSGLIKTSADFIWNGTSVANITGGSIEYKGNWKFYAGCNVVLTNCPVTFTGVSYTSITSSSSTANFGKLTCSGIPLGAPQVEIVLAAESTQPLTIADTLAVNDANYFKLNGKTVNCNSSISLTGAAFLQVNSDAVLKMGSAKTLAVNTGSTLEVLGSSGHPATITHQTAYYFLSILSGGKISANYGLFEYMGTAGVNVQTGALVDATNSFHYCTFQNGIASGRLMTINNSQTFSVYGAVFPTNTWSGSNNVSKSSNSGSVTFVNSTGGFSGEDFDSDLWFRIGWTSDTYELSIMGYGADPRSLYVCDPVTDSITVHNTSISNIVTPIRVDVYYNRTSLPDAGVTGDAFGYINSLNAQSWATFTFPATSSNEAGAWQTWFRIDTLNEIAESNESNNGGGYLTTTWNPLPVVTQPTIHINSETNQVELSWTYPIPVNQFNIYRCDTAEGAFTELAGTANTGSFAETLTGDVNFYQVKAVKTWP